MAHLFSLQQTVRLTSESSMAQLSHNGVYEVIRLMPANVAGDVSYRLKSSAGERVAFEHHLVLHAAPENPA